MGLLKNLKIPPIAAGGKWPKELPYYKCRPPYSIGEYRTRYAYKDIEVAFNSNKYEPNDEVAVTADGAVTKDGIKIGTWSDVGRQRMCGDFARNGDPISARIQRVNKDGSGLLAISFYQKPDFKREKVCKVMGSGNADAQEAIEGLSPGEALYLSEDYEHEDRILVSDVGYFGKKDSQWIDENVNLDWCDVLVDAVNYNEDSDRYQLTVRIRY